jgi:hypothetical protein
MTRGTVKVYLLYSRRNSTIILSDSFASYLGRLATLNKNINATCKVLVSWDEIKDPRNVPYAQIWFISNSVHKFGYIPVGEHFPIAKVIHPPASCSVSRIWLNRMIITQVQLVLRTIKVGWSPLCCFTLLVRLSTRCWNIAARTCFHEATSISEVGHRCWAIRLG